GAWGDYASIAGKYTAPSTTFGTSGVGMYVSAEVGRQWLGTSDAFYGVVSALGNFARGIPYASYDTWNIGIGFTYKVFTFAIPTPTCRRVTATPSPVPSTLPERPTSHRSILAAQVPTGAVRPVSSSSR